jgi:uncharacterized protein YktA (UPF0223 family)
MKNKYDIQEMKKLKNFERIYVQQTLGNYKRIYENLCTSKHKEKKLIQTHKKKSSLYENDVCSRFTNSNIHVGNAWNK